MTEMKIEVKLEEKTVCFVNKSGFLVVKTPMMAKPAITKFFTKENIAFVRAGNTPAANSKGMLMFPKAGVA